MADYDLNLQPSTYLRATRTKLHERVLLRSPTFNLPYALREQSFANGKGYAEQLSNVQPI